MQHIVIVFSDAFDELGMEGLRLFLQVGGNLFHFILGAHGFIVPVDGFHIDEIDDALEGCFLSDWHLDRYRAGIEGLLRFHEERLPQEREHFLAWWHRWQRRGGEGALVGMLQQGQLVGG